MNSKLITNRTGKTVHIPFIIWVFAMLGVLLFIAGAGAGCGAVTPKVVRAKQPSLDSVPDAHTNYANSGALGFTNHQLIVTPSLLTRYDWLVQRWGTNTVPPTPLRQGITTNSVGVLLMDKAAVETMATMTTWQAQPPAVTVKPP